MIAIGVALFLISVMGAFFLQRTNTIDWRDHLFATVGWTGFFLICGGLIKWLWLNAP